MIPSAPHPPDPGALLAALEVSLGQLAALSVKEPDARLRALVIRRRSLVLAARRAAGKAGLPAGATRARPDPGARPGINALIAAEWRLARSLAVALRAMPPAEPMRAPLSALCEDVEDGALLLRLLSRGQG